MTRPAPQPGNTVPTHGCLIDSLHVMPDVVVEFVLEDDDVEYIEQMLANGEYGSARDAVVAALKLLFQESQREERARSRLLRWGYNARYGLWRATIALWSRLAGTECPPHIASE